MAKKIKTNLITIKPTYKIREKLVKALMRNSEGRSILVGAFADCWEEVNQSKDNSYSFSLEFSFIELSRRKAVIQIHHGFPLGLSSVITTAKFERTIKGWKLVDIDDTGMS